MVNWPSVSVVVWTTRRIGRRIDEHHGAAKALAGRVVVQDSTEHCLRGQPGRTGR